MRWRFYNKVTFLVLGLLGLAYLTICFFLNKYFDLPVVIQSDLQHLILTVFLTMGVAVTLISKWVTKPLEELAKIVKDIAGGNFSRRVGLDTKDETEELAQSINELVDQMRIKIDEAVSNQSRLEAVFLSMFDGVMVVDQSQTIKLMNQRLRESLHVTQEPVGCKPLEIIRNFEIQEIVEKVLRLNKPLESKELTVFMPEERTLLIHATPVIRENKVEGAVLVFHNITELRRLENIRRDFVANVSHELRTPISTIRGYAETLLDGALDDKSHAKEFVQIIYQDSERLAKLVNDLLDLARIESGKVKLNLVECSLYDIAGKIIKVLQKLAKDRSVTIENNISQALAPVRADETMLSQVFLNLIENGIKYNKPCGKVMIHTREEGDFLKIFIEDTGIGIPQEDLPRVFERFYRVDKAHSRQLSGTGLGLSIVKHIVQAHNGEVSVLSRRNEGSIFTFTLPKM